MLDGTTLQTARQRVEAGATALDKHIPYWYDTIDLGLLDMGSPQLCVIGQLSADSGYTLGLAQIASRVCPWNADVYAQQTFSDDAWNQLLGFAIGHGFDKPDPCECDLEDLNEDEECEVDEHAQYGYGMLTHEWRDAIANRRR